MRYSKLDREMDDARAEMDPTARLKIYQGVQKKLMEDLPAIPLFMMHYASAHRPNIAGLPDRDPVWGIDFYSLYFVESK